MRAAAAVLCLSIVITSACSSGDSSGPKAGPPANLGVVNLASLNQEGVIGNPAPLPLAVVVTDAGNRPVPGVTVKYAVSEGGGTLSSSTVTTDGNGVAATTWTLSNTFSPKTVTATVTGLAVVTFTATAIAPDAGILAFNLVDPPNDTIPPDTAGRSQGIDVLSLQGIFKRDSLILTITFASPVEFGSHDDALAGLIEFDIDDNVQTGFDPFSNFFGASANAAVEYALYLDGVTGNSITGIADLRSNFYTPVTASYPGNTLVARIPMRLLGNDDGNFTIVGVLGSYVRPTDFFPNSGATLVRRSLGRSFTVSSSPSTLPTPPLARARWRPQTGSYLSPK